MPVLSLSYWESDVYWRRKNKYFAEFAPQNGGKQLIWRNYVTVTLCIYEQEYAGQRQRDWAEVDGEETSKVNFHRFIYVGWSDVTATCGHVITIIYVVGQHGVGPTVWSCGEDLSRYSTKTESVGLRKCPLYHSLSILRKWCHNSKHFSELAPHHGWKTAGIDIRYGMEKIRHCQYTDVQIDLTPNRLTTSISCHWRTRATRCITANVLQTKVDAQCYKLATELSWQRLRRSTFSRYSEWFDLLKIANFNIPTCIFDTSVGGYDPAWVLPRSSASEN